MPSANPLNEYKSEAFELFNSLISRWHEVTTGQLLRVEVVYEAPPPEMPPMQASHFDPLNGEDDVAIAEINAKIAAGEFGPRALTASASGAATETQQIRDPKNPASWGKVGRNEVCPCGSGKKYKHCHGVLV